MLFRRRKLPQNYLPVPAEDFALKAYRIEATFSKSPLAEAHELTSASAVSDLLSRNVLRSDISWPEIKLLVDSKGYAMWWAKIDRGNPDVVNYGLLIPPFEDLSKSKQVITTSADYDLRMAEADEVVIENWGKAKLKQTSELHPERGLVEKVYGVPVYGYNKVKKAFYRNGQRDITCETGMNSLGQLVKRVVKKGYIEPEPLFKTVLGRYRREMAK